jgi:hypothetical protein
VVTAVLYNVFCFFIRCIMTPNIREFDILLNQSREDVVVALSTGEEQDRTDSTITCRENNQITESSGFLRSHFRRLKNSATCIK